MKLDLDNLELTDRAVIEELAMQLSFQCGGKMRHIKRKDGGSIPSDKELWSKAIQEAKKRFDKYPSAYANLWASKWYKEKGGKWKND